MNVWTTAKRMAISSLLLTWGCGSGTRPEDMSAAQHDKEAKKDEDLAQVHRGQAGVVVDGRPGTAHLALANSFQHQADDHEAAADALRADQVSECAHTAKAVAGTCPLAAYEVTQVESTAEGVRVTFAGPEAETLLQHARCHVAHGAVEGRKSMKGCPLYHKALHMTTEVAPGGAVLVLSSDNASVRKTLQGLYVPRQ